jgi:hypothetical protein
MTKLVKRPARTEVHDPTKQVQVPRKPIDPFWTSPWTYLGSLAIVVAISILMIRDLQSKRLLVFLSLDSSHSALSNPADGESICRNAVGRLISGDTLYTMPYADTTEIQNSTKISSPNANFQYCNEYRDKKIPRSLGKSIGTSPEALLDRVIVNIKTERKRGNQKNIVAIGYLQEAEPGPNIPKLNFDKLAQKLLSIQKEGGTVLLMGTSGIVRKNLEDMSSRHAELTNLRLCSIHESVCIREAFDLARQ